MDYDLDLEEFELDIPALDGWDEEITTPGSTAPVVPAVVPPTPRQEICRAPACRRMKDVGKPCWLCGNP